MLVRQLLRLLNKREVKNGVKIVPTQKGIVITFPAEQGLLEAMWQ